MNPQVESFYDPATSTYSHVVFDRDGGKAAIIDPVLDFDLATGRVSTASADKVLEFISSHQLCVDWILETHAHADHLTAADYLKGATGAKVAIGCGITDVQARFKVQLELEDGFATDGSQFDHLFADGENFQIGDMEARVLATPGHTDDSITYVVGDAAFVGDTVFSPEAGTGRTDFPGGDARKLYRSIRKLFSLPPQTRVFLCHDYPSAGRGARSLSSIEEQQEHNVHVGGNAEEDAFVQMRTARDATLPPPKLIVPALNLNLRAGRPLPLGSNQ